MAESEIYSDSNEATYCPEDNKIRLYVGRVPRDEYEALRAQGWKSTAKQDCDFVAHWTPQREDTAISYAGYLGDEDQGPADRAADRAERFGGYCDKRRDEAHGHADGYDAGPMVHGFQSAKRAEGAARRHDRQADKACDQWRKAEYWQTRTDGVIGHALYVSAPSVRMGRIKRMESEQRKSVKAWESYRATFAKWSDIAGLDDAEEATRRALALAGSSCGGGWNYEHPRTGDKSSLYSHLTNKADPITGHEAAGLLLANATDPDDDSSTGARWRDHYKLRLEYERQMLEAQGGRAGALEIVPGGRWCGALIVKVSKSNATGRVVSVHIKYKRVEGYAYNIKNAKGCDFSLAKCEVERAKPGSYAEPTPESLAELAEVKQAMTSATKKANAGTPKLINPTDKDAQRLQDVINAKRERDREKGYHIYDGKAGALLEVCRMTQEVYSSNSKGAYRSCEPRLVGHAGRTLSRHSHLRGREATETGPALCKVRMWNDRVIVIEDKPQKALPASVWEDYKAPAPAPVQGVLVNES